MFRAELKSRLENIFGFRKVSFDAPADEVKEQDTLFVEVRGCKTRATQGEIYCRVDGVIVVYAQAGKLPYGYFNKRIAKADPELTRHILFYDIDTDVATSPARLQNIVERRVSFVFLFKDQYDPAQDLMAEDLEINQVVHIDVGDGRLIAGDSSLIGTNP